MKKGWVCDCHLVIHPVYYRLYYAVAVSILLLLSLLFIIIILCIIQRIFFCCAHSLFDEQYSIIYYYGRRRIPAIPIIYGIYIYTYAKRLRRYLYIATLSLSLSAVTAVLANMVVFFTLFLNLYGHTVVWDINIRMRYIIYLYRATILTKNTHMQTFNVHKNIFNRNLK